MKTISAHTKRNILISKTFKKYSSRDTIPLNNAVIFAFAILTEIDMNNIFAQRYKSTEKYVVFSLHFYSLMHTVKNSSHALANVRKKTPYFSA